MKGFARVVSVVVAAAVLAASCSKDKESGYLSFERPAVYLEENESATVGYSLVNVDRNSVWVTSAPEGWDDITVNHADMTLIVKAPEALNDDVDASGLVTISGSPTAGGTVSSATLFVGVVDTRDMTDRPANSYLVNAKNTHYTFDAMHKGDGVSDLSTASVGLIWQTPSSLVQYLRLDGDKVSFYVGEEPGEEATRIKSGNALIGAYDAGGNLIWSWHVWATDYDPEAASGSVVFSNYAMMTRNLGALNNANATEAEILASYGLYYQWGRKDPFVGPAAYNAADGASASMYNASGSSAKIRTVASTPETGTIEYATRNPLTFITVTDKDADWVYAGDAASPRWSETQKTVYDPCPYGWRVAPALVFNGLVIFDYISASTDEEEKELAEKYRNKYGWTLGNPHDLAELLFIGAGRRSYRDGSIQNYYDDSLPVRSADQMQPWVGYYWTADAGSAMSSAFCFWFRIDDVTASGVRNNREMGRANGMQVRCVRDA